MAPECREKKKKAAPVQTKGVLLTYKKSSIASDILLLYYSHEILRLCSCEKKEKKSNITVDREAQHLNIVMCLCVSGH